MDYIDNISFTSPPSSLQKKKWFTSPGAEFYGSCMFINFVDYVENNVL